MLRTRALVVLISLCGCPSLDTAAADSTTSGPTSSAEGPSSSTNSTTADSSSSASTTAGTSTASTADTTAETTADSSTTINEGCVEGKMGEWDDMQSCWDSAVWQ